jgi:hypothetical protein
MDGKKLIDYWMYARSYGQRVNLKSPLVKTGRVQLVFMRIRTLTPLKLI